MSQQDSRARNDPDNPADKSGADSALQHADDTANPLEHERMR